MADKHNNEPSILIQPLKAPMIEHGISRLVIDPNRAKDDPTLIPEISDATVVPGCNGSTDTKPFA